MIEGWSPSSGWESFEGWKRWFLQETGRVDPPPPRRPSVPLFGVYRVFSAPEGIQTEVEVAGVEPAAVAAAEREVRWRARAFLAKQQERIAQYPDHYREAVVFVQVGFEAGPGRWVSWSRRRWRTWAGERVAGCSRRIAPAGG
jgi:hypothetical protein